MILVTLIGVVGAAVLAFHLGHWRGLVQGWRAGERAGFQQGIAAERRFE